MYTNCKVDSDKITLDNVNLFFKKTVATSADNFVNDLTGSATKNWNNTKKYCIYYQKWRCMRTRVNRSKGKITISEDWKTFSKFLLDVINMENSHRVSYHLDKDLISNNSLRHYSKDNCVFIPAALNRAIALDVQNKKQILTRYKIYYKKQLCSKSSEALQRYIDKL